MNAFEFGYYDSSGMFHWVPPPRYGVPSSLTHSRMSVITMDLSTQQASLEEIARSGLLAQAWQPEFEPATQGWQDWFACGDEIV